MAYHLTFESSSHKNVTNITFIFETFPNAKPKEKKVGGTRHIISLLSEKVGGHVPRVPHQFAPMLLIACCGHIVSLYM